MKTDRIIHEMETMEQGMIRSAEIRDAVCQRSGGRPTRQEWAVLCNIIWNICRVLYDLLRKENMK